MLHVLVAGEPFEAAEWFDLAGLPPALRPAFETTGTLVRASGPGVFGVGGHVAVVLPRCFSGAVDDAAQLAAAGHTVRVLRRYADDRSTQSSVLEDKLQIEPAVAGDFASVLLRLEAALLLWEDFRQAGPLSIAARRLSLDERGRIHWPRTIAATTPLVSGLDVVYPEPVRTRHALQPEHPLTRLHAVTAEAAGHFLGALRAERAPRTPPPREALDLLRRHERSLFQDRQREIAALLRRYYAPSHPTASGTARDVTGIFALSFPLVWERMLFVALGSAELPQLPRGRYRRTDGREEQATSFRLDLLLDAEHRGQRVRVVLDAKDYQPGKLPVHEAINKQILYRLLLARQSGLPLDRVGNAFLAPAVVERSDGVSVHAVHDLEGEMGQAEAVGRIIALEVDFARVASAYVRGRPDQHLRGTVVELVMGAFATSERARFPKE